MNGNAADNGTGRGYRRLVMTLMMSTALWAGPFSPILPLAPASAQSARTHSFNIPSQPLNRALRSLADQSGVQIAYQTSIASGAVAPAVSGTMTTEQAVSRLISGSGLSYGFTNSNTVTITNPAQTANGASPDATTLAPIVLHGNRGAFGDENGFVAADATTGSKVNIPINEAPYAVSVVTREQIEARNAQTVEDTLRYSPGVVTEQASQDDRFSLGKAKIRGFDGTILFDGTQLDTDTGNYSASTDFDPYLLERVEVLSGPASVLYGQAGPGGAISLQSKRPTETPFHEVVVGTGSHGRIQGAFDFSGPIDEDGQFLYRLTGVGLHTGTQVDHVDKERIAIAPAFTWQPDEDTKLTVLTSYQHDPKKGGFNALSWVGTYVPGALGKIPTDFFWGEPGVNVFERTQYTAGYEFEHHFDDVFTFRQNLKDIYTDGHYIDTTPGMLGADGRTLSRRFFGQDDTYSSFNIDNQIEAKFSTGGFDHTLLVGLEHYRKTHKSPTYVDEPTTPIDIFDPVHGNVTPPTVYDDFPLADGLQQTGVYAQDFIAYENWRAVAGIRRDWAKNWNGWDTRSYQDSQATTGRLGLAYVFDNGFTPYISYSTSFKPESGLDADSNPFKPTTGTQYEVGLKYQPEGLESFFNLSAFNITQQNVKVTTDDPATPNPVDERQVGEIRSRGITASATMSLSDNFDLLATYTYLDVETTKSTPTVSNFPVGHVPEYRPHHTASIWGQYTFDENILPGLTIGGGVRLVGKDYVDSSETAKLPGFVLVDAAIKYDFGVAQPDWKGLEADLNVSNLFDKQYLASCTGVGITCRWGDRRLITAQLKYRW